MLSKKISYKKKFEQLSHQMISVYMTFYVWKALQNEAYNEVYKIDGSFWSAVIPSLQHEWFMALARLYEDSKYSKAGSVISVYALIPEHPNKERAREAEEFLRQNSKVIKNIARIRDHRHAHNNANFLVNPKVFEKLFALKYREIEEIFEFTYKMLGILSPEDGHGYVLDHLKEDAERDTKDLVEGVRYFEFKRKEYRDKWVKGERSNYEFPPTNEMI